MESLCTFKACLHAAPIKCDSCSSRRLSSYSSIQSRRCFNFPDRTNFLKAGLSGQLLTKFEDKSSRSKSLSKVVKAGEAEATVQSETAKEEIKGSGEAATETAAKATPAAAEAKEVKEEGLTGKYWVLRCTSKGTTKNEEIVPGDGLVVGAAPNVTGSAKAVVLDMPMVSSSHARIYSRERKSYRTTVHEYFIMDLGSTNGTILNRSKLRPNTEVKLTEGDTIKFGDETATFIVEAQA